MRSLWLFCLTAIAACAGSIRERHLSNYSRANPGLTFLAWQSIDRRCPFPGLSSAALRVAFGPPSDVDSGPSSVRWTFVLKRPGPVVNVTLSDDTVVGWTANDRNVWRKVPAPPGGFDWPRSQARVVNEYLAQHPSTSDAETYAMARGCPQPGMAPSMIAAMWGEPTLVDTVHSDDGVRVRFTYGFGVEGQSTQLEFARDSLVRGRYCGWPTNQQSECALPSATIRGLRPNKRLKLAARVRYGMTTLSSARRSLSAIR